MDASVELSGFTLFLVLITISIVLQIRMINPKKTFIARIATILTATAIYSIVVIINLQPIQANGHEVVYVTQTGSKYHSSECRHLKQSKIQTTLEQAIDGGYGDCAHCSVPKYISQTITKSLPDLYSKKGVLFMMLGSAVIFAYFGILYALGTPHEHRKQKRHEQQFKTNEDSHKEACIMKVLIWILCLLGSAAITALTNATDLPYVLAELLLGNQEVDQLALLSGAISCVFTIATWGFAIYLAPRLCKRWDKYSITNRAQRAGQTDFQYAKSITDPEIIAYCESHLHLSPREITEYIRHQTEIGKVKRYCAQVLIRVYSQNAGRPAPRTETEASDS